MASVLAKAFLPKLSEGSLICMGEPTGIPSSQNLVTFSFTTQEKVQVQSCTFLTKKSTGLRTIFIALRGAA
jgi:hypothetical protein